MHISRLNVLNRLNEVQVLQYSYKCNKISKYYVIFATREGEGVLSPPPHGYVTMVVAINVSCK